MHLVPYDTKLLFNIKEEIKETVVEPVAESTDDYYNTATAKNDDCVFDPLYSGSKISWYLKEKGINQGRVAHILGISQPQVSSMLSGRKALKEEYVKKIAEFLGVDVSELTGCKCIGNVEEGKEEVAAMAGVKINDLVGFKNKIREWLSTRGMKTRDLSGLLGFDERDIRISRWYHGTENPTMSDLERICGVMGCEIGWLTGNDELKLDPVEENAGEIDEKSDENPREFKDIIAEYMAEKGLSKKAFGKLTGIDTSTVSRWFISNTLPSPKLIQRIVDATGLNFDGVKIYEGKLVERDPNKERVETILSKNIRAYLTYKRLNQAEFSKLVNCNRASLYAWLNEGCIPNKEHLDKVAEVMGVSVEELLGETTRVDATGRELLGKEKAAKEELHVGTTPIDIPVAPAVDEMVLESRICEKVCVEPVEECEDSPLDIDIKHSDCREDSPLDIDILKAEMYEDLVQRTRDELMEDLRKELLKELKPQNPRQNVIDDLKRAANTIYDNAESIVGNVNGTGGLTVTIYLEPHEVPRINVDKDIYF